jgi:hypothetical protein
MRSWRWGRRKWIRIWRMRIVKKIIRIRRKGKIGIGRRMTKYMVALEEEERAENKDLEKEDEEDKKEMEKLGKEEVKKEVKEKENGEKENGKRRVVTGAGSKKGLPRHLF